MAVETHEIKGAARFVYVRDSRLLEFPEDGQPTDYAGNEHGQLHDAASAPTAGFERAKMNEVAVLANPVSEEYRILRALSSDAPTGCGHESDRG